MCLFEKSLSQIEKVVLQQTFHLLRIPIGIAALMGFDAFVDAPVQSRKPFFFSSWGAAAKKRLQTARSSDGKSQLAQQHEGLGDRGSDVGTGSEPKRAWARQIAAVLPFAAMSKSAVNSRREEEAAKQEEASSSSRASCNKPNEHTTTRRLDKVGGWIHVPLFHMILLQVSGSLARYKLNWPSQHICDTTLLPRISRPSRRTRPPQPSPLQSDCLTSELQSIQNRKPFVIPRKSRRMRAKATGWVALAPSRMQHSIASSCPPHYMGALPKTLDSLARVRSSCRLKQRLCSSRMLGRKLRKGIDCQTKSGT
jgi:hypothetical protein